MINNDTQIRLKVENIIKNQGAELIDFRIFFSGGKHILRCIVDYSEGGVSLDVCSKINKKICAYLDEDSVLGDNCVVEINSPGLDRPLRKSSDFLRVKGRVVSLWLNEPVCGKAYLEAQVLDANNSELSLKYKDEVVKVSFSKIKLGKEKIKI